MPEYPNKHGRKPGRGLRPWLLIPKVLSLAALLGGFLAASVLLHTHQPQTLEQWTAHIGTISTLFLRLIVPAVLLVVLFGLLLFFQHPKVFLKARWFRLKAVLLILLLPPLHLTGRGLIHKARAALADQDIDRVAELMAAFTLTADLAAAALVIVIVIGRLKPRLGQRPKTLAQQRAEQADQAK